MWNSLLDRMHGRPVVSCLFLGIAIIGNITGQDLLIMLHLVIHIVDRGLCFCQPLISPLALTQDDLIPLLQVLL